MSIILITGDHPRHVYLAQAVARTGRLSGWVVERREAFVPTPPDELSQDLQQLFKQHFEKRDAAEQYWFAAAKKVETEIADRYDAELPDLNGDGVHAFIKDKAPDLILSYGCHKLTEETTSLAGRYAWNCHGGLSPWYRGVMTHFWPSYLLEPQMTGVTLHETTEHIDGGGVIYQTGTEMVAGDGLHLLAGRALKTFADKLPDVLLHALDASQPVIGATQFSTGRIWTARMWRPEHLRVIYETFDDRIVDMVLEGELEGREAKLIGALTSKKL